MAKGIFAMRSLVGLLVMLFVSSFIACDNEDMKLVSAPVVMSDTIKRDVPQDTTPEKETPLEFYLIQNHESDSNVVIITDTVGEKTTSSQWVSNGKARLSFKDYRYTTELRYKNLNVAYSNTGKVVGRPMPQEVNGYVKYTSACSFPMEDGNVGYIDAENWQVIEKVNGETHTFEVAKLADFEVVSFENSPYTRTRGTYVADSCDTKAVVKIHYVYEGSNEPAFDVLVSDVCHRKFTAEDGVEAWSHERENRVVTGITTEDVSFVKVAKNLSGSVDYLDKSTTLLYEVKAIAEREMVVKSFDFIFNSTSGVSYGETKLDRIEGKWKIYRRGFSYKSVFRTPMGDIIETTYSGYTEGATYDDGDVVVEFPVLNINLSEGNTTVTPQTGDEYYDKARFNNIINADYQGYPQSVSESVVLLKEKVRVTDRYWDEATAKKTITLWNIRCSIDFVERSSDGSEKRTNYVADFEWVFGPLSYWSIFASNASYFTGAVSASVNGTQKSKEAKDGAKWKFIENAHSFLSSVTAGGGVQTDEWYAKTINDISIETKDGLVYSFGHDDYQMVDGGAKLGNATSTADEDIYPYTHALTFGIGGVTAEKSVDGEIHGKKEAPVIIPDVPTYFGKLQGMSFIVINNPDHTDYMYGALAYIEGGKVVPGIWDRTGEFQWFLGEEQDGSSNLNGCVYDRKDKKWVPVHAWDSPDLLQYDSAVGGNADNQSYDRAFDWKWDEDNKVNGHPSVTTDRFSYTMQDGVVSITDVRHGVSLGSWTYKQ